MRGIFLRLLALSLLLSACVSPVSEGTDAIDQPVKLPQQEKPCGDGVCDGPENAENCPQDCMGDVQAQQPVTELPPRVSGEGKAQIAKVTNPTSGVDISVLVFPPGGSEATDFSTLVLVPGGSGSGQDFTRPGRTIVEQLNEAGYLVVLFDPDGRGRSGGVEDNNGFIHQDGLAAVIRFA